MADGSDPIYKLGEYWLGTRKGSPNFYRVWWDASTGRIRRASLGTSDLTEAKRRLKDWFARNHLPDNAPLDTVALATVIRVYYEEHAMDLPSHEAARIELTKWLDHFGEQSVDDATKPAALDRFMTSLLKKGLSANYVNRIMSSGRAALNRAWKKGLITHAPYVPTTPVGDIPPKGRPLSLDEVRALYHTTDYDYLKRFILWLVGTAARPDAILELTTDQIDLEYGLVQLNPKGRRQTKKYRPTVKLAPTLRDHIGDGPWIIMSKGKPRKDVKYSWRKLRKALAFNDEVVPYSLRHTMARHLRASGIDSWQVSAQLGHKQPGLSTTEIYAPFDPNYLADSTQILDKYLKNIMISPDELPITCSQHAQIEARRKANEEAKSLKTMVGGTRFELVTPTMST